MASTLVGIAVLAALATPPDVLSFCLVGMPAVVVAVPFFLAGLTLGGRLSSPSRRAAMAGLAVGALASLVTLWGLQHHLTAFVGSTVEDIGGAVTDVLPWMLGATGLAVVSTASLAGLWAGQQSGHTSN